MVLKKTIKPNRKGVIFTLIALLISALLISTFFALQDVPLDTHEGPAKIKISSDIFYIKEAPSYTKNLVLATTKPIFSRIIDSMIVQKSFTAPGGKTFTDMYYDCILGRSTQYMPSLNCSDLNLTKKLKELDNYVSDSLSININTSILGIHLYQQRPWEVMVEVNMTLNISDAYGQWTVNQTIIQNISILRLRDPIYEIRENIPAFAGLIANNTYNVNESALAFWSEQPSTLNGLAISRSYFHWDQAPSFLDRMHGDSNPSNCCGIASILVPKDVPKPSYVYTHLDYEFFQNRCIGGNFVIFNFTGLPFAQMVALGINPADRSIQDAIVPGTRTPATGFPLDVNMTNPIYLVSYTPAVVC